MKKTLVVSSVLAGLMLCSAGAAHWLTPTAKIADTRQKVDLETMVPRAFGEWEIDPDALAAVAPNEDAQAMSDKIYDQVLSRTYRDHHGNSIMLTITYGSAQTNDLKAHRQEVCYGAQGFEISNLNNSVLQVLNHRVPVTRMLAVKGPRSEPVTYWFTMGDEVVMGRLERLMVQVKYSFAGVIPDGVLVRVSNITPDAQQGYALQNRFLNDMARQLDQRSIVQLLGTGQAVLR